MMKTLRTRWIGVAFALSWLFLGALTARAVPLNPGDIIVADNSGHSVFQVDPVTGDRILVDASGTGPEFFFPVGIAFEADGTLLVTDQALEVVFRVDPVTGDRTIFAGGGIFFEPWYIAVEADGNILVVDNALDLVLRFDPVTGGQVVLSDGYVNPGGIAVETSGGILLAGRQEGVLYRIEPTTGEATVVSSSSVGAGPNFANPASVAVEPSGDILVIDLGIDTLFRVDPVTGDRTIVSSSGVGTGQDFGLPFDLTIEADGQIIVADNAPPRLFRVDPVTGDRAIMSAAGGPGTGPFFVGLWGVDIVPLPQAGSISASVQLQRIRDAGVVITWGESCRDSDTDFAVYEGIVGDFTSHEPVECSTNGAPFIAFVPSNDEAYFLVVPNNGQGEGSYGNGTEGPRPPSSQPCYPVTQPACE